VNPVLRVAAVARARRHLVLSARVLAQAAGLVDVLDLEPEVVDAFLDSCERSSGGKKELCACLLAKIQRKYDFEEFSVIEAKVKAGRTPDDFVEFMGKARAECTK